MSLVVADGNGCTDTVRKTGFINIHKPEANFTMPTRVCVGALVAFVNTSLPSPTAATWDFGDGNGSSIISPFHTYGVAGTYKVTLITGYNGCTDTISKTIIIDPAPNVNFKKTPDTLCPAPQTVQFSPISTSLTSLLWNFGDPPATSTATNPFHTYNQNGKYTVKLIATDGNGCTDSLTKVNFVELYPLEARISK